jgi:hypothetical protein
MANAGEMLTALEYLRDNYSAYSDEITMLLDGTVDTWDEALNYYDQEDEDDDYYEDDDDYAEYVVHRLDTDIEEIAYWSNRFGWIGIESATIFDKTDTETYNLPVGVECEWKKL